MRKGTQLLRGRNTLEQLLVLLRRPALGCRPDVVACLLFEGVGIVLAAAGPYLLKLLVDALSVKQPFQWQLPILVFGFVIAWTGTTLLTSLRNVHSTRINSRLTRRLAASAAEGFLSNGRWRAGDGEKVHGLIERLPYSLVVVLDGLVWRALPLLLQLALSLAVIARLMPFQYVVCFSILSGLFVAASWLGLSKQVVAAEHYNRALVRVGGLLGDILKSARRVVSNGAVGFEIAHIEAAYIEREKQEVRFAWSLVYLSGVQWAAIGFSLMVLLGLAVTDVVRGGLSASDFILLQAYAIRLLLPLAGVGFILSQSSAALMAIGDVLDLRCFSGKHADRVAPTVAAKPAHVEMVGVTFSYPDSLPGLTNVSADFPAGSFSVIVGKNGSGKSTLAQCLAGLLTPDSGQIMINGRALSDIPEDDLFRHVLYVPQRTTLLNRDLRSNLLYPPACHSEADALRLLQQWNFYDGGQEIELDRIVGSQGDALSGGQIQKLELARLLGVHVPSLILDESSSALDPASETLIISDLRRAMSSNTTLILVTHRVELAGEADQVIWMASGTVRGVGSHTELRNRFNEYGLLWNAEA